MRGYLVALGKPGMGAALTQIGQLRSGLYFLRKSPEVVMRPRRLMVHLDLGDFCMGTNGAPPFFLPVVHGTLPYVADAEEMLAAAGLSFFPIPDRSFLQYLKYVSQRFEGRIMVVWGRPDSGIFLAFWDFRKESMWQERLIAGRVGEAWEIRSGPNRLKSQEPDWGRLRQKMGFPWTWGGGPWDLEVDWENYKIDEA